MVARVVVEEVQKQRKEQEERKESILCERGRSNRGKEEVRGY